MAGANYRGHVDAAGELQIFDASLLPTAAGSTAPPPADLWGLENQRGQVVRLFAWSAKDLAYRAPAGVTALPLTPVFAFEAKNEDILRNCARRLGIKDEEIGSTLVEAPAVFQH